MLTIVNVEQAKAWDGDEGDHWVLHADRYDRAGRDTWAQFLAAEPIQTGDRVLDIGCGAGRSTIDAVAAAGASGSGLGVDLSRTMLDLARKRAADAGATNVEFEQADAQVHAFEAGAFDVAISRMGAMFFADFAAAFGNVRRALRDGGRLAVLSWRKLGDNEWLREIRSALAQGRDLGEPPVGAPSPFGLADRDHVTGVLTGAGFDDIGFTAIDAPVWFGDNADDAFEFMRVQGVVIGLTETLDDATRQRAFEDLHESLRRHEGPDGVTFASGSWLITARARPARP